MTVVDIGKMVMVVVQFFMVVIMGMNNILSHQHANDDDRARTLHEHGDGGEFQ